jgi:hypothetical protein
MTSTALLRPKLELELNELTKPLAVGSSIRSLGALFPCPKYPNQML